MEQFILKNGLIVMANINWFLDMGQIQIVQTMPPRQVCVNVADVRYAPQPGLIVQGDPVIGLVQVQSGPFDFMHEPRAGWYVFMIIEGRWYRSECPISQVVSV